MPLAYNRHDNGFLATPYSAAAVAVLGLPARPAPQSAGRRVAGRIAVASAVEHAQRRRAAAHATLLEPADVERWRDAVAAAADSRATADTARVPRAPLRRR